MVALKDHLVLITGAAGTLGRALCHAVTEAGGTPIRTDVTAGDGVDYLHDITSPTEWDRVVTDIDRQYGRLDGLVNNAGIVMNGTIEDTEPEDFRRVMTVNVEGSYLGSRACWRLLLKSAAPSIVNVSSAAGMVGSAGHLAYCTSKGAVRLMTKSVALHGAAATPPVRCNSLHPSLMPGAMARTIFGGDPEVETRIREAAAKRNPMGRLVEPAEVAQAAVFLLSRASSFTTGSELLVEGGATAV